MSKIGTIFVKLLAVLTFICMAAKLQGAAADTSDEAVWGGPGVEPPKVINKEEPEYTRQALRAGVEGDVLLSLVVGKSGVPRDIYVLSPLGFGLDEAAVAAVSKWRFRPGSKDGNPVDIRANIYVSFRLGGQNFDAKAERDRTRFNAVASHLHKSGKPSDADVQSIRELAKDKMPTAEYVLGLWELHGSGVPQNVTDGMERIQRAADKSYGPAIFFIGNAKYRGTELPKDAEAGLKLIQESAVLGEVEGQYMLGQMYEKGIGVASDPGKARRYYRLCAAQGIAACEFQLGELLLAVEGDQQETRVEAAAWLELAAGHNFAGADKAAAAAQANLTEKQKQSAGKLQAQLERPH